MERILSKIRRLGTQIALAVADQSRVLGFGIIQRHTHHSSRMAGLLEKFDHLGVAIGVDRGFSLHQGTV